MGTAHAASRSVQQVALLTCALAACGGDLTVEGDAGTLNDAGSGPDTATAADSGHRDAAVADTGALPPSDADMVVDTGTGADATLTPGPRTERMCTSSASETEAYRLPAPTSLPTGVSFLSDWENRVRAGGFGGVQAMDGCRMAHDPIFSTWHGLATVRVEVNPGDDPISSGGERSEVIFMQTPSGEIIEESRSSGRVYFATSYYFPDDWEGTVLRGNPESWSAVLQFHPGGGSGLFAILMAGVREQQDGQRLFWTSENLDTRYLDDPAIRLGEWVDLVFDMDFSAAQIRIYRRNQNETTFRLVMDESEPAMRSGTTHMKQGLYRGSDVGGRTDVLWIGPTSRGESFAAVEMASFGTNNGV